MSATNTYTGSTSISAGTLTVSNASGLGTVDGTTTVASGATLAISAEVTVAENVTITGTGVSSAGALNFAETSGWSGTVSLAGDSTIQVASTKTATVSGAISGDYGVTKTSAGTLVLSAANTYTGSTTISNSGGSITVSGSGSLGSGTPKTYAGNISLGSSTTFTYASSVDQMFSGVISGSGTLSKSTSTTSKLTLSGSNDYTGPTSISAGILSASNSGSPSFRAAAAPATPGARCRSPHCRR